MTAIPCPKCGSDVDASSASCPSCGEEAPTVGLSAAPTIDPDAGSSAAATETFPRDFGRFRLVRELGRGGMGVVYEAEDTKLVRNVALKTLFTLEGKKSSEERFLREAQIAGTLDHPNVVSVYDYGTEEGVAYYTMPLVGGMSLDDVIPYLHDRAREPAPDYLEVPPDPADRVRLVLRWFEGALAGLEHAHAKGIVHRDIKPSNLILDATTGHLRLMDFGLARAHHLTGVTRAGTLLGTVAYMSPEQVRRSPETVDARSDVYSMGVTIYRTLLDQLPYEAPSTAAYLDCILHADVPAAPKGRPGLHRDLLTIVAKSMEKAPAQRYRSAAALADDLARFRRMEPIEARPVGPWGRLTRWARRRPAIASLLSLLLVAAVVVGVLYRVQARSAGILRQQDVERAVVDGNYASITNAFDRALAEFDRALDTDPDHFEARVGRAMALLSSWEQVPQDGLVERALDDLRVAERLRPDLTSIPLLKAGALEKLGNDNAAAAERELATAREPKIALDFELLGQIRVQDGDCDGAIAHYDQAIEQDPQRFWAILRRGLCQWESGNLDGARLDYEVVTHLVPDHAWPHNNLANVLYQQQEHDRAFREYGRALEIEPENATIHYNYAQRLLLSGEVERAEAEFREAVRLDPVHSMAWSNLGYILSETGREEEAIAAFEEGLRVEEERGEKADPGNIGLALNNLCDAYLSRGDPERAEAPCTRTAELAPDDPVSHYNLATYKMLAGDPEGALESLARDVELGDDDAEYLENDEVFAPLRDDPRLLDLLKRMRERSAS